MTLQDKIDEEYLITHRHPDNSTREELVEMIRIGRLKMAQRKAHEELKRKQQEERSKKEPIGRKLGVIIKASSELEKDGGKYVVDTTMNIKTGLDAKTKRDLIKSIIITLNDNFDDYEFFYKKKN